MVLKILHLATRIVIKTMATTVHGRIDEFQPQSEPLSAYIERVNLYFAANDIRANMQVSVFLAVIGVKNYALLQNLLSLD